MRIALVLIVGLLAHAAIGCMCPGGIVVVDARHGSLVAHHHAGHGHGHGGPHGSGCDHGGAEAMHHRDGASSEHPGEAPAHLHLCNCDPRSAPSRTVVQLPDPFDSLCALTPPSPEAPRLMAQRSANLTSERRATGPPPLLRSVRLRL